MKVRDIMRSSPWTIDDTEPLGLAQLLMIRNGIRHLPVMGDHKLVGILAERDVLSARAEAVRDRDWWTIPVREAMHTPPQTANPDDSLTEVMGRMALAKIGALPVVTLGQLVGIITVSDVLDAEVRIAMEPAPVTRLTAADVMTAYPRTIRPEAPLLDAVALMVDHHVRHVPVVDATGTIVGVLSERDVHAIGDPIKYVELRRHPDRQSYVRDVMTRPPVVVPFDQPLLELARHFVDGRLGALPVVDKFGALVGIVSYVDALRVLAA